MLLSLTASFVLTAMSSPHPGICLDASTSAIHELIEATSRRAQRPSTLRGAEGSYHSNWERKQSGSDFRDEIFDSLRESGLQVESSRAIVIDDHFEAGSHGAATTNEFRQNSSTLEIEELFEWEELRSPGFVNKVRSRNLKGVTINISYSTGADENIYNSLDALADAGADLIISSGNRGGEAMSTNTIKLAQAGKAIVVGAHNMEGLASHYSQHRGIVHLTAGVGREIQIDKDDGQSGQSDWGTSYSAPQVAGAWADLRAILPNATRQELLNLLQTTSVSTLGVQNGDSRHGAGALNVVKLLTVAKKMRMGDADPYDTSRESVEAYSEAATRESGGDVHGAMDAYRKAFLLGQFTESGEAARLRLIELMKAQGLDRELSYYESLSPHESERSEFVSAALNSSDEFVRKAAEASIGNFEEPVRERYLANAFQSGTLAVVEAAVSYTFAQGESLTQPEELLSKVPLLSTGGQTKAYSLLLSSEELSEELLSRHFTQRRPAQTSISRKLASVARTTLRLPRAERAAAFRDRLLENARTKPSSERLQTINTQQAESIAFENGLTDSELWAGIFRENASAVDRSRQFRNVSALPKNIQDLFLDAASMSSEDRARLASLLAAPNGRDLIDEYFQLDSEPDRSRLLQEFRSRASADPNSKL